MSSAPAPRFDLSKATGSERQILAEFLDFYREIVKAKVHGLTEDQLRERRVGSLTTPAGIIKHLAATEREWFQFTLAQLSAEEIGGDHRAFADASWEVGAESLDELFADYDEACARSRAAAARFDLDHVVKHHRAGDVSLRWIYVHLIEETARHAGHADILREQIDGGVGFQG